MGCCLANPTCFFVFFWQTRFFRFFEVLNISCDLDGLRVPRRLKDVQAAALMVRTTAPTGTSSRDSAPTVTCSHVTDKGEPNKRAGAKVAPFTAGAADSAIPLLPLRGHWLVSPLIRLAAGWYSIAAAPCDDCWSRQNDRRFGGSWRLLGGEP